VQADVTFNATLTIDDYLFGARRAPGLRAEARSIANLATAAPRPRRGSPASGLPPGAATPPRLTAFYADLQARLAGCGEDSFLLQLGWGAG
jgi:hypothetical protein